MSYDIHALHVERGEANATALERVAEREELEEGEPLDPGKEARKRSIATALTISTMGYEVVEHDYAEVADEKDVPEDQVRREIRHVLVYNGTLLVEIEEEHATVKVPVSGELDDEELTEMVFATLDALHREGRLVPFDPQLGRELDLDGDRHAFLESFRRRVEEARRAGAEEPVEDPPRAPWWKRLFDR